MQPLEPLAAYLRWVEKLVSGLPETEIERYVEEILTPSRANLRIRTRFNSGVRLEINEALIVERDQLRHLDYRYHCQDAEHRLVFRYDCTPHFPRLASFPHHKHLPESVVAAQRPGLDEVLVEAREERR